MSAAKGTTIPFPRAAKRRAALEIAFLPAALEIVESPPSPIGRAISLTIIFTFCIALIWAAFGTVDIVVTASGRIVPSGGAKVIQPFETGVLSAIRVHDGQRVSAGDVLIELDQTITLAEQKRLSEDLIAAQLSLARLRAIATWLTTAVNEPLDNFRPPAGAIDSQVEVERQLLASEVAEQSFRLAEVDRQTMQKEAERATVAAQTTKLQATIPLIQQRVDTRKALFDKALGSKLVYLQEKQDLVGMQQDLSVQQSRMQEAEAAIASLRESRKKTEADFRRNIFSDLAKEQAHATGLAQDELKAARRAELQKLAAPVDGIVQQLAVHTVGGVVTPAQALAVVVPLTGPIEIEANLANRDVGFVRPGQEAPVKVETFNFTRYGLIPGSIVSISRDAVAVANPQDNANSSGNERSEEGKNKASSYIAHVALGRTAIAIDGRQEQLTPGMAVMVEIKTGSRSVLSYLLSPLERNLQESMRER